MVVPINTPKTWWYRQYDHLSSVQAFIATAVDVAADSCCRYARKIMAINFHPHPGLVLICDFNTGFKPPEMVKKRPVVVVSQGYNSLVTVVPLSTTVPEPARECHVRLQANSLPGSLKSKVHWAKCDCITSVAYERLDRVRGGKNPNTGKREFVAQPVSAEDLTAIRKAIISHLRLSGLTLD